jgi:hypothetical protein
MKRTVIGKPIERALAWLRLRQYRVQITSDKGSVDNAERMWSSEGIMKSDVKIDATVSEL